MSAKKSAAAEQAAATADVAATYDVTLNKAFTYMEFRYLPSHHHVVDQTILDAMKAAGVVADVKQLS
jgi:uncharacterized protein (DUF342 family)